MKKETVENRVQEYRTKAGMTQDALAERCGVSRQTIIAIEKGSYAPSVALALRIARVFNKPTDAIFFLT